MNINDILKTVDHTMLTQTATYDEIKKICDEGVRFNTATVCIPPYYVAFAKEYTEGKLAICTVVGFPNGYATTAAKVFEAEAAVKDGASEIDMVINLCMLKNKEYDKITEEIKAVKEVCGGRLLKVIIETCLLTDEEKIKMCELIVRAGADFIKTSTGFSTGGATFEDIEMFARHVGERVSIKASGGIRTLDDAKRFIELGADRLGTSKVVKLADLSEVQNGY